MMSGFPGEESAARGLMPWEEMLTDPASSIRTRSESEGDFSLFILISMYRQMIVTY
jgi:hypothetical protein